MKRKFWQVVNEETSSSKSGLHFGHYVVGSASDIISYYHAARVTVVIARAIQLEWWSWGLSVMLKKTLGVTLVTKLRAILFMEADFNATNKIIYGNRMMEKARKYNLMPEEIFSERNRMADDGTLSKTLFCKPRETGEGLHSHCFRRRFQLLRQDSPCYDLLCLSGV
jgi:hypothetical protein